MRPWHVPAFLLSACIGAAVSEAATYATELTLRREASWPADSAEAKPFREAVAKAMAQESEYSGDAKRLGDAGAIAHVVLVQRRSQLGPDAQLFDTVPKLEADPLGGGARAGDRLEYRVCGKGTLSAWTLVHARLGWQVDAYSAQAVKDCTGV